MSEHMEERDHFKSRSSSRSSRLSRHCSSGSTLGLFLLFDCYRCVGNLPQHQGIVRFSFPFSVIHPVSVLGCRGYIIAMTGHLTSGAE